LRKTDVTILPEMTKTWLATTIRCSAQQQNIHGITVDETLTQHFRSGVSQTVHCWCYMDVALKQ